MKLHLCVTGLIAAALLTIANLAVAQQSQELDGYTVHYNALNTELLTPEVATAYGIQRSSSRALINITVLDRTLEPVHAEVTASAINLTGQRRNIEIREIADSEGAIYYIGILPIHHLETYTFTLGITPEGHERKLDLTFQQQFHTR